MKFFLTSDTAGARVGELAAELRHILEDKINTKYANNNSDIGIAIRCLPDSYNRNSFVRYTQKDNYLTIDFCVSMEAYKKLYKVEQKFELGKTFLEWLDRGLSNKNFLKNNPDFDKDVFINDVKNWGNETDWFAEEVDYSQELDYSAEYWQWKWLKK
ncbi:MAG: hypothetical protein LBV47_01150 [Bacteroidales bacterium]|jgi:hypothetical protein|nr:hypothetical protein [Bacteroidales bacterium]